MKEKVLIIKTGYCEILNRESNLREVSLGDVFRSTAILHPYKNHEITWVTSKEAFPLLENNPFIKKERLLPFDFITESQIGSEEFDTIINLEKVPGICALSDRIKARKNRYGFAFDTQTGEAEALENSAEILSFGVDPIYKKKNKKTFQEHLFKIVGRKWEGEGYVLGYVPTSKEEYDVGFNVKIGSKWPNKAWSLDNWNKLEELLGAEKISVTRQDKQPKEVLTDLEKYIDWINSSRVLVSNDSLGLHIGLALKKKVIGLFGPTSSREIYFYNRGEAILPNENLPCLPCFKPGCLLYKNSCINLISPKEVSSLLKEKYL
jgi:heptosyltransferase-2